jgi:hypothetical protein
VDTDDNLSDFTAAAPTPRNSATALNPCQPSGDVTLDVTIDPPAGGTVTKVPDQATYTFGSSVDLTANPASGWFFQNWTGNASGSTNPLTVVMDGDKSIVAHFTTSLAPNPIVISQVYGGGGNSGATYKNDYIELFNRGALAVNVTGWSVQYASASGTSWSSTTLIGTIQPAHYYLVQQSAGAGGTLDLPTPDAIGGTSMSAGNGKVALVSNTVFLSGTCPTGGAIEDFVGYGSASCAEASPTVTLNNLSAAHRKQGGCVDTHHNLFDFETLAPAPRNSAGPVNVCSYWVDVPNQIFSNGLSLGIAPNPTRGPMRLYFALPYDTEARLRVFDLQGRVVATIVDGHMTAGRHLASWNGLTQSGPALSGVYFVRLQVPGMTLKRTVVITH